MKLKIINKKSGSALDYKSEFENKGIGIMHYPTNNCQLGSVAGFDQMFQPYNTKEDNLDNFKELHKNSLRPLLLIDLSVSSTNANEAVETIFKDKIVFKQPYISTNGNGMVLYMVKTENLLDSKY